MAAPAHAKLDAILDEEDAGMQVDGAGDEAALYAAHLARTRAEDAAADALARLVVAQVQLAEYAEARAEQAAAAAADARRALEGASGNASLTALCTSLEEAAEEAAAFATQQRADAERLKRSAEAGSGVEATAAAGGAAAAAGEAAEGDDGNGGKRRSTAGGKRRSGGAGSADASKRRGSANGRAAAAAAAAGEAEGGDATAAAAAKPAANNDDSSSSVVHSACSTAASSSSSEDDEDLDAADEDDDDEDAGPSNGAGGFRRGDFARAQRALAAAADPHDAAVSIRDRARYIPLRLRLEDRRLLRLLEASLGVSEYVDRVDVLTWRSRASRASAQVRDLCAILSGLVVAQDYRAGQRLVQDRDFAANAEFFQDTFEIGRRYKIMNPDKMRETFGKLIYMLMDAQTPEVQELLEFPLVRPLRTVHSFLEERVGAAHAAALLDDPLCTLATAEIPAGHGRPRSEVQRDIRAKEKAREALARRYARPPQLTQDDVLWCLYSIADNNAFLLFNRDPIDRLLRYFHAAFPKGEPPSSPETSLAICAGKGGARLTHSHARQWAFVQQSLTLWREVTTDMFRLYALVEGDMLGRGAGYRLADTGQGLNRLQAAPSVARAMAGIVSRVQQRCGSWVGSAFVHLGDSNVPNALFFVDKYSQVPRVITPVVLTLDAIPPMCSRDPNVRQYVQETFGGVERAQRLILTDFCRHAFDGSGADSNFSAGSCVDGRLTAAWNWANQLEKKPYAPLFRLAGWTGFDGSFRDG